MSDFNSCGFGAITPELIFRSILRGTTNIAVLEGFCALGCVGTTATRRSTPFVCTDANDLFSLLQRSLVMADDGKVALRVVTISSENGAAFDECIGCANGEAWYQLAARCFTLDDNGDVALIIGYIT